MRDRRVAKALAFLSWKFVKRFSPASAVHMILEYRLQIRLSIVCKIWHAFLDAACSRLSQHPFPLSCPCSGPWTYLTESDSVVQRVYVEHSQSWAAVLVRVSRSFCPFQTIVKTIHSGT